MTLIERAKKNEKLRNTHVSRHTWITGTANTYTDTFSGNLQGPGATLDSTVYGVLPGETAGYNNNPNRYSAVPVAAKPANQNDQSSR